jgi:hypothetical protein
MLELVRRRVAHQRVVNRTFKIIVSIADLTATLIEAVTGRRVVMRPSEFWKKDRPEGWRLL